MTGMQSLGFFIAVTWSEREGEIDAQYSQIKRECHGPLGVIFQRKVLPKPPSIFQSLQLPGGRLRTSVLKIDREGEGGYLC